MDDIKELKEIINELNNLNDELLKENKALKKEIRVLKEEKKILEQQHKEDRWEIENLKGQIKDFNKTHNVRKAVVEKYKLKSKRLKNMSEN